MFSWVNSGWALVLGWVSYCFNKLSLLMFSRASTLLFSSLMSFRMMLMSLMFSKLFFLFSSDCLLS